MGRHTASHGLILTVVATCCAFICLAPSVLAMAPDTTQEGSSQGSGARAPTATGGGGGTLFRDVMTEISGTVMLLGREGWVCVGPVTVSSMTPLALSLYYPKKNTVIDLKGRNLKVFDKNLKAADASLVTHGVWVYACRNKTDVNVYVLPCGREEQR